MFTLKEFLGSAVIIGAAKIINGIYNLKKDVPIFTVVDNLGNSLKSGSVNDCLGAVEAEEITGEMFNFKDGQTFGTTKVDGTNYYSIVYTGDKTVKKYAPLITGGILLLAGLAGIAYISKEERKLEKELEKRIKEKQ